MRLSNICLLVLLECLHIQNILACTTSCPCVDHKVFCHGRYLRQIPTDLPRRIKFLDFKNNKLPIVTTAMMRKFKNLRGLILAGNGFSYIQPRAFSYIKKLKYLDLSNNKLGNVSPKVFSTLDDVRTIFLSRNQLEDIEEYFNGTIRLQTLSIKGNQIKQITKITFRNTKKLKYLDLSNNRISFIHQDAFGVMTGLKYLLLNRNNLKTLHKLIIPSKGLIMADFSECNLTTFVRGLPKPIRDLRYELNEIASITYEDFANTTNLGLLTLSWNKITDVDQHIWHRMKYIYELHLDNNKLAYIPRHLPPNMRSLLMQNNVLYEIPANLFKRLKHLETIDLRNNHIKKIHGAAFRGLQGLRNLKLSNNRIPALKRNVFRDLVRLDALDLSNNPIIHLDNNVFKGLSNMIILEMANVNANTRVASNIFRHTKNLKFLDLNNSPKIVQQIINTDVRKGFLFGLEDLNLMNDGLHRLDPDFPYHLPALQTIKLPGNPWCCDKLLIWFHYWLNNRTIDFFHPHEIRCATPTDLSRKPVKDLYVSEFRDIDPYVNSALPEPVSSGENDFDIEAAFKTSMEGETFQTQPTGENLKLDP